jgi:hypothetical protein
MIYSTYRVSLDIHKTTSQAFITVKRGDVGRRIIATLTENGKPYMITDGCHAVLVGRKADATVLYNDCVIDGNRIIYNFTEQTVSAKGKVDCEFDLYGVDNALLLSPNFTIIVEDTPCNGDDVVVSADETNVIQGLIKDTTNAIDRVNDAIDRVDDAIESADSATEHLNAAVLDLEERVDSGEFNGKDGADGADGYTPIKGIDYYTEEDKEEMVNRVISALPNGDEVSY